MFWVVVPTHLIRDVEPIHGDAGGAALLAAQRQAGDLAFGRIDIPAILHLHAGFKLSEVEEIAPIQRQVANQALSDDPFQARLGGAYGDCVRFHVDCLGRGSDFQAQVAGRDAPDLDQEIQNGGLEAACLHLDLVGSGKEAAKRIHPGFRGCLLQR